jgi:hypothetical protein
VTNVTGGAQLRKIPRLGSTAPNGAVDEGRPAVECPTSAPGMPASERFPRGCPSGRPEGLRPLRPCQVATCDAASQLARPCGRDDGMETEAGGKWVEED